MRISLQVNSQAAQAQLRQWGGQFSVQVKQAVTRALQQEAKDLTREVRHHVSGQLRVVKQGFLRGFNAKVLPPRGGSSPDHLPALYVGSRIPWAGIHESGGTINKKLLIPLHGRIGPKRFKTMVMTLMRGGNAYFVKNRRGQVLLMAENLPQYAAVLAGVKRRYRQAAGIGRLRRGADIPIAVLVPFVTLKKRLNIENLVLARVAAIAVRVDAALAAL